eukprot:Transcript_4703.p2 GENE.Transcript_4703~~Transcript_4703.p2  ORF type:complete len:375 (+),score=95.91 Transcript_4703:114-1127(+)
MSATCGSSRGNTDYYRADGVRITHDPFAPGMADKYGRPGATDEEGFDPYRDSVGPGIYGGIVKRDENAQVVIGAQYQNHNPRPGPVYAGGGYTPMSNALGTKSKVEALLDKYPDLVNDVSTGGAQPLHMCGMSQVNQHSASLLISRGADIEALDTYGMTPLHRCASNNLASGAEALLEAGADPANRGGVRLTPLDLARQASASDVIRVLQRHGAKRKDVMIATIVVSGAGDSRVDGEYAATSAATVPVGFGKVCEANGWDTRRMWAQLNGGATWFGAKNGAYIYWNQSDRSWWIDEPDGHGVYKAAAPSHAPPQVGWAPLGPHKIPPALVATMRIPS